jgi:hypothetical protein
MKPQVGMAVQYFTHKTLEDGPNSKRLEVPIPLGPWAATITAVHRDDVVTLAVTPPKGRSYPVFNVNKVPTTPVQHYWAYITYDVEE